jgi:hypothetical protein
LSTRFGKSWPSKKADPFKRWYLQLLARRIKNYELELFNKFDGIVAFTEQDKASILSYGAKIPVWFYRYRRLTNKSFTNTRPYQN